MEKKENCIIQTSLTVLFIAICIWGIGTSIAMNYVNRSLWLDEAMLSYSFGQRGLLNLCSSKFEANQIAPVGWLYLVKLITVICGNTEFTLRIASIFFYGLTIAALHFYIYKCLGCSQMLALASSALYANFPLILRYSNVFKPYIADGFFVLLVLIAFAAFCKGKLKAWQLCLIWCVLIWFSNPVVFVQAGCLLVELFYAYRGKDKTKFRNLFLIGAGILSCFVFYYFVWLRDVAVSEYMQEFWENDSFPLIPISKNDLVRFAKSINTIFGGFGREKWVIIILSAIVVWRTIQSRKKEQLYIIVSVFVAFTVSWAHFFPISDRLWIFFIPLTLVFCMTGLSDIIKADRVLNIIVLISLLVLAIMGGGIQKYWSNPENVYLPGEELNDEILYLEEKVQKDDHVYVYFHSTYGWQYKLGYDNKSIGGYDGNVILGTTFFNDAERGEEEIAAILNYNRMYIASSHLWRDRFLPLTKELQKEGLLELVSYEHRTPLWFFCKDMKKSKINAGWEIEGKDGNKTTVLIHNYGPAWLNHEYEDVRVVDSVSGEDAELPKLIAPGETVQLTMVCAEEPFLTLFNEQGPIVTERSFHHEQ